MKNKTLVSVCMPVYNREDFIEEAVRSVLDQTYSNFEFIIVDNGSTDSTVSIIQSFNDDRIKLVRNEANNGVIYSRNLIMNLAKGTYIAVLDSDDSWFPTKLEKQLQFMEKHPQYGVCGTWGWRCSPDGTKKLWNYPKKDAEVRVRMLWGNAVIHSSMFIRKSTIEKNNITYSADHKYSEDYELLRNIIKYARAYNIPEPLLNYRIHKNQITVMNNTTQRMDAFRTSTDYLSDIGVRLLKSQAVAYNKLFNHQYSLDIDSLHELREFFEILLSDTTIDYYEELKKDLSEKWFLACYHSSQNGLSSIKTYFSGLHFLQNKLKFYTGLKFVFKCLALKSSQYPCKTSDLQPTENHVHTGT